MRSPLLVCLTGLLTMIAVPVVHAADFPEPDQLPATPGFPDPLVMLSGKKITTPEQWASERRPELKALFQHYMYGDLPNVPVRVEGKVVYTDPAAFDGKATLRDVVISIAEGCPPIHLLLVIPNGAKGPVPAFVGMNFCGNHAVVKDSHIPIPDCWMYPGPGVKDNRATEAGRGAQIDVWALDQSVARGYAVATFYNGDVDPDVKDKRAGMRPWLQSKGANPATIMAWAWGIVRAVDYLTGVKEIDPKRIAVVGHSRLGKTALVAAAFDERIALSIPHQAGCGGTAPDRSHSAKAESVERINTSFPHWFNDNFKKFNKQVDRLPFDQNGLVALVAPRAVLCSNAVEDQWANPDGQFEILRAADPVYRLLGSRGLGAEHVPAPGLLVDSPLGYYIRAGKHSMTRDDWKVFLDFADRNLKKE